MTSKTCLKCNGIFSVFDFPVDNSKKDKKSIYCKNCHRKLNRQRRMQEGYKEKRNKNRYKEADYNRNYMLKTRYGITLLEYNQLFEKQGCKCRLCGVSKSDGRNFVVDHSHRTGKIRSILCNVALGSLKDSIELAQKAVIYLKEFEGDLKNEK